jgi:hypothetical protein
MGDVLRSVLYLVAVPIGAVFTWTLVSGVIALVGKELKFSGQQKFFVVLIVYLLCVAMGRNTYQRWVVPTIFVGLAFLAKPYWLLLGRLFPKSFGDAARELGDKGSG